MKKILRRIVNDLWAYILWIVVVIVAWTLIFGYLTHIDVDEKVCVFIGSQSAGFEKYEELNEKRPDYLKKVEVNAYSINDGMFSTVLSIFGYEAGDILILPESRLSEESCPQSFAEISPSYCQQFANKGFYTADGKVYGLLVHEKGNTESLISCIDYGKSENDDNYYLLFNVKSLHLSDLSDESKKSNMDGAIKVALELLAL